MPEGEKECDFDSEEFQQGTVFVEGSLESVVEHDQIIKTETDTYTDDPAHIKLDTLSERVFMKVVCENQDHRPRRLNYQKLQNKSFTSITKEFSLSDVA